MVRMCYFTTVHARVDVFEVVTLCDNSADTFSLVIGSHISGKLK
jgi:hypothetical protein